ncbi:MAG: hypothetical protein WCD21_28365 [Streptomyces sp.]
MGRSTPDGAWAFASDAGHYVEYAGVTHFSVDYARSIDIDRLGGVEHGWTAE